MIICCCGPSGCAVTLSGFTRACDGTNTPGATVAVKDHATGTVVATGTSNSLSRYTLSWTIPGPSEAVDVVLSKPGSATSTTTATVVCGANTQDLLLAPAAFNIQVNGCGGGQPGVGVTFTQPGYTFTGTTDAGGRVTVSPVSTAPGTITWNAPATPAGYTGGSRAFSPGCDGGGPAVSLGTATGYACTPDQCCPGGAGGTGPPYVVPVYPAAVVLNDGVAATPLSPGGAIYGSAPAGGVVYSGCTQLNAARAWATPNHALDVPVNNRDVWVYYEAWCSGLNTWEVEAFNLMSLTVPTFTPLPAVTDPPPSGSSCGRFPAIWSCSDPLPGSPTGSPWCGGATGYIWHAALTASSCPPTFLATGTTNINNDDGNVWPAGVLTVTLQQ